MRYRQLKWTAAFYILKNTISCFIVLVCIFYQLIMHYASVLDLFLLLMITAFGITNTYALV